MAEAASAVATMAAVVVVADTPYCGASSVARKPGMLVPLTVMPDRAVLAAVREPSTLWSASVPSSAWVRSAAVLVATLLIVPFWGFPLRLPTRVRSWSPIQMPSSSSSLDTTV